MLVLFKMVAMWYCCDCGLLNESTHHNAVYCHCDHHVCGECSHAKRKSSHHHHNHDLHKRFSRGTTRHKTKAIHHHHDTRHEMTVQIGSNLLAGILVAAITSAACSLMWSYILLYPVPFVHILCRTHHNIVSRNRLGKLQRFLN